MSPRVRRGVSSGMTLTTSISPCLWFDDDLEEAAEFYTAIFPNSSVGHLTRYTDAGPGAGRQGDGRRVHHRRADVPRHQRRAGARRVHPVDLLLGQLRRPGRGRPLLVEPVGRTAARSSVCGWLKDRFGLAWQIVPTRLYELVSDPDPARAQAATEAMLGQRKIVIAELEAAADAVAGRDAGGH